MNPENPQKSREKNEKSVICFIDTLVNQGFNFIQRLRKEHKNKNVQKLSQTFQDDGAWVVYKMN